MEVISYEQDALFLFKLKSLTFVQFIIFAAGYVDLPDVFKIGFVMATINAIIWGVVGTFWWKFLGLY